MVTIYPYSELGHADHGWLDARHHFSFASYRNPKRMHFGVLRVINDDKIAAGSGFGAHPHDNMEIITYVREGAITHRDSMGNTGRTGAGDVQVARGARAPRACRPRTPMARAPPRGGGCVGPYPPHRAASRRARGPGRWGRTTCATARPTGSCCAL